MIQTMKYPLTKQRIKRRTTKSGQYMQVTAMLRRLEKEKAKL